MWRGKGGGVCGAGRGGCVGGGGGVLGWRVLGWGWVVCVGWGRGCGGWSGGCGESGRARRVRLPGRGLAAGRVLRWRAASPCRRCGRSHWLLPCAVLASGRIATLVVDWVAVRCPRQRLVLQVAHEVDWDSRASPARQPLPARRRARRNDRNHRPRPSGGATRATRRRRRGRTADRRRATATRETASARRSPARAGSRRPAPQPDAL